MKKFFLRLLPTVFALAVSSGVYLFSAFGLQKLFSVWNLSPETLSRAPGWAAWIYLNADGILNLSFLLPACILLFLPCSGRKKLKLRHLWFALSGAVCAGFLIGILLLSGSIRYPVVRVHYAPAAAFGLALTVFLEACLSARLTRGIFADCPLLSVRFGASVIGQIALLLISGRIINATAIANRALIGLTALLLFMKTGSLLPEILFCTLFRFTEAVVFGFPDLGGAYYVSEPWLTGADASLINAGVTLVALFILSIALILYYRHARKESELCRKRTCFSLPIFRQGKKS